jgi:uncharacterized protein YjbI with pentapeptide repeats
MVSKDRSWWQKAIKALIVVAIIAAIAVAVVLIYAVVRFYGTGFDGYNKITTAHTIGGPSSGAVIRTEEYQPGKTLWDWMSLLLIPVILALVGFFFIRTERRNEQAIAKQRAETEQNLARDNQQEVALQGYLDRMAVLCLEKDLRKSTPGDEVRTVARVRTLTMLCQLNTRRINDMLVFLRESKLITDDTSTNIITFSEANLSNVNLQGVDFHSIDLSRASLYKADLIGANLIGADLRGADLSNVKLNGAILIGADLIGTQLNGADLRGADLNGADLRGADLNGADLRRSDLNGADLRRSDLRGAKLQKATYNTKVVQEKDVDGKLVTLKPTQWPQGFDPKAAGAICDDC